MQKMIVAGVASLYALLTLADVRPAGIFTDHAVLQQGEPVRIWGTASAGEKVTVSFAGQIAESTADENGKWKSKIDWNWKRI